VLYGAGRSRAAHVPATAESEKNMENVNTQLVLILAGVTIAVLLQAGVLLGIFLAMRKAVKTAQDALQTAKEQSDQYRAKLMPIIETGSQLIATGKDLVASTETLINNLKPQLETAATELADMTRDIRTQVNQLQDSVNEVAQKARLQVDRVDGMTTSTLNGLERVGTFLNQAVNLPIRQVNGVVAAAKAVIETLRAPAPPRARPRPAPRPTRVDQDKDLFV
jgi:methyl-accepting chemotaxis protein